MFNLILDPQFLLLFSFLFFFGIFLLLIIFHDLTNGVFLWLGALLIFGRQRLLEDAILPDISLDRILWLILFGIFALQILLKKIRPLILDSVDLAMIFLVFVSFLSMFLIGTLIDEEGALRLRSLLTGFVMPFTMYFISKHLFFEEAKVKRLIFILAIFGIYLSLIATFEHFHMYNLIYPRYIADPQVGIHFGRARGPFVNAAVNGTVLSMIFIFVLYASFYFKGLESKIAQVSLSLMPFAIFFTYTRAVWFGFLFGLACVIIGNRRLHKYFLLILLFVSFFLIAGYTPFFYHRILDTKPVFGRINLEVAGLRIFFDRPFFGCGFGRFKEIAPYYMLRLSNIPYIGSGYTQHDTFSAVLAELGLFGFIPLLFIFVYFIRTASRLYYKLSENEFLGRGLIISSFGLFIIYVVNSLLIEMKFFQFANSIFFIFAGILVGLAHRKELYG